MKLRVVRWSKFVTRMGKMINDYEIFMRIREGKNHSEDLDVDGDNITLYVKVMECEV
jgi:hypothetical protein